MAIEIERKFLVSGEFKSLAKSSTRICQGYICSTPERTVRIRIRDDKGYITIKGVGDSKGMSRFEWEKGIPLKDAEDLLRLCEKGAIDKRRYLVDHKGHTFEVDEFHGNNEGLVVAEIELRSEDEDFERPSWLGKEVTGDSRYYNASLAKVPYCMWNPSTSSEES